MNRITVALVISFVGGIGGCVRRRLIGHFGLSTESSDATAEADAIPPARGIANSY